MGEVCFSAGSLQGSVLNISSVARECAVERKAAENYFSILDDLLIAYRLPVFTKRAKRRMIAHPKFYFFDVGVYRTLRPMLTGLRSFLKDYPMAKAYLIYGGKRRMKWETIEVVPVGEALKKLVSILS